MRSSLALLAACACLLAGCGAQASPPATSAPAPATPVPATPAPASPAPQTTSPSAEATPTAPGASPTGQATAGAGPATADAGLVARLRRGGYVLYVRHTASEATQDDPTPDLADPATQRNLSEEGRAQAREIGQAVRRLRIPIGQVLASPYRRTRETAELAFGQARESRDLINEVYPGADDAALAAALRRLLDARPAAGVNTVLVSHGFNLARATGLSSAEGDTFVFVPGDGDPVARIGVDEWRSLKE
ncbi:hypothetical protein ETD86_04545 [Nonomuraea turkmeniaca]|uniref:Histidine phosphatase family protein n=1 Tax=Nonomuraea turkmeniaca TaxID=103838 RepID=A0A5S4FUG4_9ACTN|nr:histidine phosphatase family protein [Nonomuraea turkmeniaca]TMR24406.1 hypothetical protein ETD86_04545 [Nonomuraea turkmeniaca]